MGAPDKRFCDGDQRTCWKVPVYEIYSSDRSREGQKVDSCAEHVLELLSDSPRHCLYKVGEDKPYLVLQDPGDAFVVIGSDSGKILVEALTSLISTRTKSTSFPEVGEAIKLRERLKTVWSGG